MFIDLQRMIDNNLSHGSNGPDSSTCQLKSDRKTLPRKSSGKQQSSEELTALHVAACNTTDNENDLSFTIVWSPLPLITWLIPFVGHTGICSSSGIASDFQGPYFVGSDGRMAFGAPTRALKIPGVTMETWDACIQDANQVYSARMHNIFCDNCHSHVAYALNKMGANAYGVSKWNMVNIATLVFFRGRFLSWWAIGKQFLPITLIVIVWFMFRS